MAPRAAESLQRRDVGRRPPMSINLEVRLRREERGLERLLGLVGRRGYEVTGVDASLAPCGRVLRVRLRLESERSFEQLVRHVAKLYEVAEVRVMSQ